MLKQKSSSIKSAQHGVALVEALVAILIFSIGILGIVGMQANMLKNTTDSKYRADASNIAQERLGQIWADPDPTRPGYTTYVESNISISALPNGYRTTAQSGVQYTVTVTWQAPGEAASHVYAAVANIAGG